jgi:hypothetical protein
VLENTGWRRSERAHEGHIGRQVQEVRCVGLGGWCYEHQVLHQKFRSFLFVKPSMCPNTPPADTHHPVQRTTCLSDFLFFFYVFYVLKWNVRLRPKTLGNANETHRAHRGKIIGDENKCVRENEGGVVLKGRMKGT